MDHPFLSLAKTPCFFTFASSRPFLHNNKLRPRTPPGFPKPIRSSSSSSQVVLISTTEFLNGSVVFRFGDESEKAAFDELNRRLEAELSEDLVRESNAEESEVDASPASSPEENAVLHLSGDSLPSTNLQYVEGESHSRDVSDISAPRNLEYHTPEGLEGYPSTIPEDELIAGKANRRDVMEASTTVLVGLHKVEGSVGYPYTKSEDDLTEGKEDGNDVQGASTPMPVESLTSEGSEEYPSTKSEDQLTEGKEDRTDVTGASTSTPVELDTSLGSNGYPSEKSEDGLPEGKEDKADVIGASIPTLVELHTAEGSEGYTSARSEDEVTEGKEHKTDVTGASTPPPVKLLTFEGSEGYHCSKSEEELTEGKEDRIDVTEASTPRTIEPDTDEGSELYPSTKTEDELSQFTERKTHLSDVSGASTDRTEDMLTVEGAEKYASIDSEGEFADDKTQNALVELIPRIMASHSVEGTKGSSLSKSEDKSTDDTEQRDVSGASTPVTVELHTIEGAKGHASTESKDKFVEGKVDRTDVLEAATTREVELHRVELAEDTPFKKSEDELTEVKAHRKDVSGAPTPSIMEFHTVEVTEGGDDISGPLLLLLTGTASLPHPSKALTGGEDSFFVASGNWLGVADGVTEWSLEGITPGLYAHHLMENCQRILSDCKAVTVTKPEDVLVRGVTQTECPGSSTVLVAHLDGQALHVANIGNSGFIIIRNGVVFNRSSPMIHGFNFPLQIVGGVEPSELIERYSIDLDVGDVIVTATDGLFDNLYEKEIASIVTKSFQRRMRLQDIAELLATSAQEVGQSTSRRSPFADAVEASGYVGYTGGKLDDTTVLVSHVQKQCSC